MDKYEYKVRSEEISKLIGKEKYAEAVKLADTIDWRRVKSAAMLLKIAALYRISRRNEDSREMLMLAYERYPTNRSVVYSLCELSIELDDVVAAIEYYKQFVKLAPKDNGVYTLRYRILEAQEASLEERIEILEELKKKDYQEEWAYELAYLYHRVGLSTKCVEECDDIILWFGDGPYVMKAMELKARHVPLTEMQQQNYDIMRGNAARNYSGGNYAAENYDAGGYSGEGYDGQDYGSEGDDGQDYGGESYDGQDYGGEGYNEQGYYGEGYDGQDYGSGSYNGQDYDAGSYDGAGYGAEDYSSADYAGQGYAAEGYDTQGYGGEDYAAGSYAGQDYAPSHYVDDGYGNLSYVDGGRYQDNGYTGEFYVEQVYDENGNLISPDMYADSGYQEGSYAYPQGELPQDTGYEGQEDAPKEYHNGLHLVEKNAAPAANSGDMSQYNTINLQKVVAESMKELFPDDNDDVFAEDREKYNTGQNARDTSGDTRIFAGVSDHSAGAQTTGRVNIAQMVTGVSEEAPEPHTGAVKKVLVPGDDARLIKSDSDMEELRDTTEQSVEDEHVRMESNDENVYHEQGLMDTNDTDEASQTPSGPMKIDDVLVEWERMKQDNARKNQEQIKKRVLTQTGKIFTDFDNSIKSGILGELEREEEEAERKNQAGTAGKGRDADATGDIPQQPASDDDFDVAYVVNRNKTEKPQEPPRPENLAASAESGQVEGRQPDRAMERPEKPEEAPGCEPADTSAPCGQDTYETADAVPYGQDPYETQKAAHTQEIYEDTAADDKTSAYTQEIPTENAGEYDAGSAVYTEEIDTEDVNEYAGETYAEESDEYTENAYEEDSGGDTGEAYAEDTDAYTEETFTQDAGAYTEELFVEDTDGYGEETYAEEDEQYPVEAYTEDSDGYTDDVYGDEPDTYTEPYGEDAYDDLEDAYSDTSDDTRYAERRQNDQYNERDLDPEDAESIAEMAKEDALKTQEIKMNTADLSTLSEKIVATTKKEASGAKREEIRDFTPEEQTLFENFAVTKKIKKQIIYALENMTLAAYTGNVIITGDAGLDTVRMAKNLVKEYQAADEGFSGKLAKITGEKINQRNIKDVFEKLDNGGIIIEKANGMSEEKLYELAINLNQDTLGIVVILEDTKKEITKLLEKQAMIVDYFNIRIDLMEMDNNALVAYAKNYALALEYSIDELGTLALYTRIANMQSGNHVVTKDEVRDIIDEAIWKSKKSKIKNFVDVLFARRYDDEDMIVLKERDFM